MDFIPGDSNDDGEVNISDVILLINSLLSGSQYDLAPVCDMNGDGKINITDAIDMINYILNN